MCHILHQHVEDKGILRIALSGYIFLDLRPEKNWKSSKAPKQSTFPNIVLEQVAEWVESTCFASPVSASACLRRPTYLRLHKAQLQHPKQSLGFRANKGLKSGMVSRASRLKQQTAGGQLRR